MNVAFTGYMRLTRNIEDKQQREWLPTYISKVLLKRI